MNNGEDHSKKQTGVLFSKSEGQRTDRNLHDQMLESVSSVADEAGIRILMQNGLSREMAIKLVRPGRTEAE